MSALSTLRRMPLSLQVLTGVLLISPLWTTWYLGDPWTVWERAKTPASAMMIATYWVFPWLAVAGLLSRSIISLPLLLGMGLGLVGIAYQTGDGWTRSLGLGAVLVMITTSIALLRRDILYPFMVRRRRYWRRFARSNVNFSVSLLAPGDSAATTQELKSTVPAVVHDCSIGGLGLSVELESFDQTPFRQAGSQLRVQTKDGLTVDAQVVAIRAVDPVYQVGLAVPDPRAMERLILAIPKRANKSLSFTMTRLWARESVRRSVMAIWIFSIFCTFFMQSCNEFYRGATALEEEAYQTEQGQ